MKSTFYQSALGTLVLAGFAATATAQHRFTTNPNPTSVATPIAIPGANTTVNLPSQFSRSQRAPLVRQLTLGTPPTTSTPSDIVVTQNATQNITPLNSISCNAGGLHTDNWYYRVFDVSGLGGEFVPQSVDLAVEVATSSGGTQPVRLRIYDSADLNDTLIDANIVHESTIALADQSGTIVNIAASGLITSGSMIVEIFTPDGQGTGESFFIGSNADGQTGPSYLRADACGLAAPADIAAIGFPDMHIVLSVNGKLLALPEETLTQNVNKDITPLNSISCNAGGLHTDNWYYRVFDSSAFGSFTATSIDVGIEVATSSGGTQPIRLRVYDSADLNDTLIDANIVYDSGLIALADVSGMVMNFLTAGALASTSGSVIVEVFTPDGQGTGESFFIGSNANGQTGPSYLRADACGLPAPTDVAAIGFPDMHVIINVTGEVTPGGPADFENYCVSVPNSTGGAAVITASGSNSIADNDLTLTTTPVPAGFFLYYYGPNQIDVPFGNGGSQCVGGVIQRIQGPGAVVGNTATRVISPGPYVFVPGISNFQCWYRDNSVAPDHFNTSDGVAINFVP